MDAKLDFNFDVYSKLFLAKIPLAKKVNKNTYTGRCPVCLDSKFNTRKTRLYLMRERGKYPSVICCHNCNLSTSAKSFFTKYFPEDMNDLEKNISTSDVGVITTLKIEEKKNPGNKINEDDAYLISFEKEVDKAKLVVDRFFEHFTDPIANDQEAMQYIYSRSIPDYFVGTMRLLKRNFHNQKEFRYAYLRDYILIPFIDSIDNKRYYFHARRYRNLNYTMAKYLSCPYNPDDVEVDFYFNELGITKDFPIIVCEGTISSMNLPNALSTNGIGKQTDEFIKKMEWKFGGSSNIIYANDNELVDQKANEKAKELLSLGKRVFLWSLMIKDFPFINKIKDFNDLCVLSKKKEIPLSTIEKYTASNPIALLKV